ncbi:MAG: hypothetical protein KME07_14145 [Pegethrix bostrychoides GSE-TBD4-15B]|jgi:hypothetical protein|uniref:Uncharacterized protein n=1 Tax=Pegethrix bostrychoides GSE-TBD4-15B TaxID=2839662 RepID=A0A951U5K1_9CYAN|nr:hypothetical protein [Pegethrix bostrychoides GSE-TBD4-15B]
MSKLEVRSESSPVSSQVQSPDIEWLDDFSLNTVLAMLVVIDSTEDLALLETLTPEQKRQVWDATPETTRARLKQLRASPKLSASLKRSHSTDLINAAELTAEDRLPEDQSAQAEETAAIDLEAQRQEVDLMLQEPLNLSAEPTLSIGDWVVLHAKPKLSRAEMQAIWDVIELQGNYARIAAKSLGNRLYPTVAMSLYPRPVELPNPDDLEPF